MTDSYLNEEFNKGCESFRQRDYVSARKSFEMALQQEKLYEQSLLKIIHIEIKEGKYANARKKLEEMSQLENLELKSLYGKLEEIELNFELSKKYYSQCMQNPQMQYKSFFNLARLNIQLGDYPMAKKMLETLQYDINFNLSATFQLIYMEIIKGDLDSAYRILQSIDSEKLNPFYYHNYEAIDVYLKLKLGMLKKADTTTYPKGEYTISRILGSDDIQLLNHVEKHLNQDLRYSDGCFFKYTDLRRLLTEVRDKITKMNPNYFNFTALYKFHLDDPIGFKGDELTNDICVATIIGTNDILTMYPIQLSSQFDIENLNYSQELARKRKRGSF